MTQRLKIHELAAAKKKRKTPRRSGPVKVVRVDPRAVALAHELAGDRDVRVVVHPSGDIYIKNGKLR